MEKKSVGSRRLGKQFHEEMRLYALDHTQRETASKFGVSQMTVFYVIHKHKRDRELHEGKMYQKGDKIILYSLLGCKDVKATVLHYLEPESNLIYEGNDLMVLIGENLEIKVHEKNIKEKCYG